MRPASVAEVAARVVAWHNRHPLARRITAAQVQGIGVVAMPFVLPSPAATQVRARVSEPTLFAAPADAGDNAAAFPQEPAVAPPAGPSLRERALAAAAATEEGAATVSVPPPAVASSSPPPTLRERLRTWWGRLRPEAGRGFSEDFIDPLKPPRIARFALRHGSPIVPPPAAGPVRVVLEDDGLCARGSVQTWHLRTAAIEVDSTRVRVLLGDGPDAAVIGPRLWSPARLAGSAVAWSLAMAGLLGAQYLSRTPDQAQAPVLAQGAPAPVAAAPDVRGASPGGAASAATTAASAPGPLADPPAVVMRAASAIVLSEGPPPSVAAPGQAPPPSASAPVQPPAPALAAASASKVGDIAALAAASPPATQSTAWPVNIKPMIDVETARAAKRDAAALRAKGTGTPTADTPARQAPSAPDDDKAAPLAVPAAPSADGVTYALAARSTRNRAASELLLGLMKTAAAAGGGKAEQRTEVLPSQQGWRAIWWPFHTRQEAERAHALLVSVGLEAELIEF